MPSDTQSLAMSFLREVMERYSPLGDETWRAFTDICQFRSIPKGGVLSRAGDIPNSYAFVYRGLFRVYSVDEKGTEYNKNFFEEGSFPGAMVALLTHSPSTYTIEALESSEIVEINFPAYRALLVESPDLMLYQIHYLEKNWLLTKDARELEIVQEDAGSRYQRFLQEYPRLAERLPQYHIASHLGITPTQLSRIRKNS